MKPKPAAKITPQLLNTIHARMLGIGDLGVTCLPRDPRFPSSNPAEVDDFFLNVKIPSKCPPGGTSSRGSRV